MRTKQPFSCPSRSHSREAAWGGFKARICFPEKGAVGKAMFLPKVDALEKILEAVILRRPLSFPRLVPKPSCNLPRAFPASRWGVRDH